jgi:DNA uptake protein ComE-like DNA-binding protein
MTRGNRLGLTALMLAVLAGGILTAQVGQGLLDANLASEKDLLAVPNLTPDIVNGLIAKRPFASVTDLNAYLASQKLTPAQAAEAYAKVFVHVNLNTGTREEILLIPGAGSRMAREFAEYRPWRTWGQFDKEIGKYVGAAETARLWRFVVID